MPHACGMGDTPGGNRDCPAVSSAVLGITRGPPSGGRRLLDRWPAAPCRMRAASTTARCGRHSRLAGAVQGAFVPRGRLPDACPALAAGRGREGPWWPRQRAIGPRATGGSRSGADRPSWARVGPGRAPAGLGRQRPTLPLRLPLRRGDGADAGLLGVLAAGAGDGPGVGARHLRRVLAGPGRPDGGADGEAAQLGRPRQGLVPRVAPGGVGGAPVSVGLTRALPPRSGVTPLSAVEKAQPSGGKSGAWAGPMGRAGRTRLWPRGHAWSGPGGRRPAWRPGSAASPGRRPAAPAPAGSPGRP